MRIHFSGVGGSGMSALAQLCAWEGHDVSGSDRARDRGETPERFQILAQQGIRLFPEDGSGVDLRCQRLVLSAAIESSHPDLMSAHRHNVPVQWRANFLGERLHRSKSIAVVGTSGKSTTASMLAFVLVRAGFDPEVILGAEVPGLPGAAGLCNARPGRSGWSIAEVDESDGTIDHVSPHLAIVTSLSKDHKSVEEVGRCFVALSERTEQGVLYNGDDPRLRELLGHMGNAVSYGLSENVSIPGRICGSEGWNTEVLFRTQKTTLRLPGKFNALNAIATLACSELAGVELDQALKALSEFEGLRRRMERVGARRGVTVVDDFAHNPEKIAASLAFLTSVSRRLFVFFQPHGYGPTAFFKTELIQSFVQGLRKEDRLFLAPIYYAGGTAQKSVSSEEIAEEIRSAGRCAILAEDRKGFVEEVVAEAKEGDIIAVLGARDPTLSDLARQVMKEFSGTPIRQREGFHDQDSDD